MVCLLRYYIFLDKMLNTMKRTITLAILFLLTIDLMAQYSRPSKLESLIKKGELTKITEAERNNDEANEYLMKVNENVLALEQQKQKVEQKKKAYESAKKSYDEKSKIKKKLAGKERKKIEQLQKDIQADEAKIRKMSDSLKVFVNGAATKFSNEVIYGIYKRYLDSLWNAEKDRNVWKTATNFVELAKEKYEASQKLRHNSSDPVEYAENLSQYYNLGYIAIQNQLKALDAYLNMQRSTTTTVGETRKTYYASKPQVFFRIQIVAAEYQLSGTKLKSIYPTNEMFYSESDEGLYKYTLGKIGSYQDAVRQKMSIRQTVSGAFTVAYRDGKRIPINDAVELITE